MTNITQIPAFTYHLPVIGTLHPNQYFYLKVENECRLSDAVL